jgi:hypothetical protein
MDFAKHNWIGSYIAQKDILMAASGRSMLGAEI